MFDDGDSLDTVLECIRQSPDLQILLTVAVMWALQRGIVLLSWNEAMPTREDGLPLRLLWHCYAFAMCIATLATSVLICSLPALAEPPASGPFSTVMLTLLAIFTVVINLRAFLARLSKRRNEV